MLWCNAASLVTGIRESLSINLSSLQYVEKVIGLWRIFALCVYELLTLKKELMNKANLKVQVFMVTENPLETNPQAQSGVAGSLAAQRGKNPTIQNL